MTSPLHGEDPGFKSPWTHYLIIFFSRYRSNYLLTDFSNNEKMILVQYAIEKYHDESTLISKLSNLLDKKTIQRNIDTLIGTQKVRRLGPEIIENNSSHTELPELPENLKSFVNDL